MAAKLVNLCKIWEITSPNFGVIRQFATCAIRRAGDVETHTGQVFDSNDARLARFVDKTKTVNKKFAIDLVNEVSPTASNKRVVVCDGGGGPLGHPKVFINLDKPGNHTCGYCGLRFYKPDHHEHH